MKCMQRPIFVKWHCLKITLIHTSAAPYSTTTRQVGGWRILKLYGTQRLVQKAFDCQLWLYLFYFILVAATDVCLLSFYLSAKAIVVSGLWAVPEVSCLSMLIPENQFMYAAMKLSTVLLRFMLFIRWETPSLGEIPVAVLLYGRIENQPPPFRWTPTHPQPCDVTSCITEYPTKNKLITNIN